MGSKPNSIAWQVTLPWRADSPQRRRIATQADAGPDAGVPLGGIGAGTIGRAIHGGFSRWTIKAGQLFTAELAECGFALWHAGHGARALRQSAPPGWLADPSGEHAALYPKAWHSYRSAGLHAVVEQTSPVVPELAADSDLPAGLFRIHVQNEGRDAAQGAIMFSFSNLCSAFREFNGIGNPGGVAGQRNRVSRSARHQAIVMEQDTAGDPDEGQGSMAMAVGLADGIEVSACAAFDPAREGAALWDLFAREGRVDLPDVPWTSGGGFSEFPAAAPCAALCARFALQPGESRTIGFALAWDFPVIRFGQGRRHLRHHTGRWGAGGTNAEAIALHALEKAQVWSDAVDRFHDDARERLRLPPAAAALAINELYFIADGLTVWTAPDAEGREHFGLIECPDYPLYDTLDLWVYAAAAVADLYPSLSRLVTRAYAAQVPLDDRQQRFHLRSNARFPRQRAGMLPHDLGAPNADPFVRANDYAYQDSSAWKDLNAMFVLCAWRDARHDGDLAMAFHPAVTQAMEALASFDRDGDGMIENDGTPDQTFDNIPMTGISAYCGGLWLAALGAAARLATMAGDKASATRWKEMGARAATAYEAALWTGNHFRLDSAGRFADAILAEQMFGPATARLLDLGDVIDPVKARKALRTVYDENFLRAGQGRGVVAVTSPVHDSTLYAPKGEEGLQWDEILIGFNYSFAAALRAYGLEDECRTLMQALAWELGSKRGLHFRTPAAIVPGKPEIRAQMNMRPLAAWALARPVHLNG